MYPWFRIKKRTGNANWHGKDLGAVTPEIAIDIVNEAPPQPVAKPKIALHWAGKRSVFLGDDRSLGQTLILKGANRHCRKSFARI